MVAGKYKSRTLRKVFVKVPGNSVRVHYRRRKPGRAKCAVYGTPLIGVARANTSGMRNISKTEKRPERPYGGVLSSKAMREKMKEKARAIKF